MIYSTATVPVNPQGESALTRDPLWQGLVLKARDARLFLPPGVCTKCDVIVDAQGARRQDPAVGSGPLFSQRFVRQRRA